jgi:hypothetical protein
MKETVLKILVQIDSGKPKNGKVKKGRSSEALQHV